MDGNFNEDARQAELAREEFINSRGLSEEEIMLDDFGREYIYEMGEDKVRRQVFLDEVSQ